MATKSFTAVKTVLKKKGSTNPRAAQFEDNSNEPMPVDTQHFFAFSGFASSSDPFEIFEATRGLIVQLLGDFSLEVHGVAPHQGGLAVAVQYYASQGEALELKVTELKDSFKYQGSVLFTVNVEKQFAASFEKPLPPVPGVGQPQAQADFTYFAFCGFEKPLWS